MPPEDNITKESKDKISEDKKVDENFDVGETLELDLDTDQLNLFNEKIKVAVDIGNSNVVIGLNIENNWEKVYRLSSKKI